MSEQNNSHSGGHSSSNFLAGIIIGAALTYLFATKSGRKLKDELLKEGAKALQNLAEQLEEKEEEAKAELDSAKEQAEEVVHEVPQHIEKIQKKGRRFFFRKPRAES